MRVNALRVPDGVRCDEGLARRSRRSTSSFGRWRGQLLPAARARAACARDGDARRALVKHGNSSPANNQYDVPARIRCSSGGPGPRNRSAGTAAGRCSAPPSSSARSSAWPAARPRRAARAVREPSGRTLRSGEEPGDVGLSSGRRLQDRERGGGIRLRRVRAAHEAVGSATLRGEQPLRLSAARDASRSPHAAEHAGFGGLLQDRRERQRRLPPSRWMDLPRRLPQTPAPAWRRPSAPRASDQSAAAASRPRRSPATSAAAAARARCRSAAARSSQRSCVQPSASSAATTGVPTDRPPSSASSTASVASSAARRRRPRPASSSASSPSTLAAIARRPVAPREVERRPEQRVRLIQVAARGRRRAEVRQCVGALRSRAVRRVEPAGGRRVGQLGCDRGEQLVVTVDLRERSAGLEPKDALVAERLDRVEGLVRRRRAVAPPPAGRRLRRLANALSRQRPGRPSVASVGELEERCVLLSA